MSPRARRTEDDADEDDPVALPPSSSQQRALSLDEQIGNAAREVASLEASIAERRSWLASARARLADLQLRRAGQMVLPEVR